MEGGNGAGTWVMTVTSDLPRRSPRMGVLGLFFNSVDWCFFVAANRSKFHLR